MWRGRPQVSKTNNHPGFEDNLVWDFKPITNGIHTKRSCEWQKKAKHSYFCGQAPVGSGVLGWGLRILRNWGRGQGWSWACFSTWSKLGMTQSPSLIRPRQLRT